VDQLSRSENSAAQQQLTGPFDRIERETLLVWVALLLMALLVAVLLPEAWRLVAIMIPAAGAILWWGYRDAGAYIDARKKMSPEEQADEVSRDAW
jgi:hypothetical protein